SLEEGPMRVQEVIPHAISNFATSLSVLALLLALVGVNGVMAYFVSQRSHEIGVRMALGGTAQDILRWTVRSGMRPALIGAMVGLVAGLGVATFLRAVLVFPGSPNLLFGVSAAALEFGRKSSDLLGGSFLWKPCGKTCVSPSVCCANRRDSPPSRSSPSPSASAPTPPSSASSTPFCCAHYL